jgi:hypothetical protein
VASAVSGAAAGATICLNSGSYGTVTLADVSKSSDVTLRSASGTSASLHPSLHNVRHVRLESLTLSGMYLVDTRDVSIVGNTFTGMSRVDTTQATPNANVLIDSNTFDNITACGTCYEGRLTVRGYSNTQPVGVRITNNHFGNLGGSDGVQVIGGAYGVEIGPGNEFSGFRQAGYAAHVDPIQLYGSSHTVITGNYIHDNNDASAIMAPDGGTAEQITNNVFVGAAYFDAIQLGSHTGDLVAHNTIVGMKLAFGNKTGQPPSSGNVVRDNVITALQAPSGSVVQEDYNLLPPGGGTGAHDLQGTPTFVGGASPGTMAGFRLAPGSLGTGAASDDTDIGAPVP